MAVTDIPSALAQVTANLPPWQSIAAAQAFLSAAVFLQINRAQHVEETTTNINYESLECQVKAANQFLGASAPRAFGRSRRVTAVPRLGGIA
jgi:hypothetical protein